MSLASSVAPAQREFSIRAAAARLQATERQVLRWLAVGLLTPVVEPGRNVKISGASVERRAIELNLPEGRAQ